MKTYVVKNAQMIQLRMENNVIYLANQKNIKMYMENAKIVVKFSTRQDMITIIV